MPVKILTPGKKYTIEQAVTFYSLHNSDVNNLIPTFIQYGKQASHITEFGVNVGKSLTAWIASKPKTLICYDIKKLTDFDLPRYQNWAKEFGINFKFTLGNTLYIDIEPTELLYIDDFHSYKHVHLELHKHGNKSSKFILLHDTVTFGERGQDGTKPGLNYAISLFLKSNPHWKIKEILTIGNGLTILQRNS